jgi:hypothetical protein
MKVIQFQDRESLESHYLGSDKAAYEKINDLYSSLPCNSTNAPLFISWAVLRYALASTTKEQAHSRYLGQQGLKGGGVGSLLAFLQSPALQSCSVTLQLSRITVYKVLATTLTIFHEDTLGDATSLAQVVSRIFHVWSNFSNFKHLFLNLVTILELNSPLL